MTHDPEDGDLGAAFAALREADRARVPPFRVPAHPYRAKRLRPAVLGLLVAAGLAALVVLRPDPPPAPSLMDWRSPTDFLLRTPGEDLLRTVPRLGEGLPMEPVKGDRP
jgi:hypothetical protein